MDARTDSASSPQNASARPLIAHDELRTILSNLSHELCRPLISLRAGFDLILGSAAKPISNDQRGHVQAMVVLCDDLLRLTRSYLDYAGLVQGTRPLCYGSFTIGALIREIDRQFAQDATSRKVSWESVMEGADATVSTDASRCQQIFGNLVANALKYTPPGGQVRLAARHEGETWTVVVTDSGPGIPADAISKVFEPFYRLSREEHSSVEGSGLGLAICREMVDQLGGEISISSTVGQGTRVTVRFPVAQPTHGSLASQRN
ncbi:sensor histidine kinase [Singulisphaera acidiphila]|uniref:histidine kinase n=1 Tax=Singulisphaera acidiphila (strain ATCC BAA-1392 / DSM 18658 / VKM B-2454 / MOB10) TaxID=886293 RepID=L0DBH6_SINAD|nr:HAMP domain-containing sensor histidine kinase [Singulisphaera acidiphila]AGA26210.1 histidine kinase [Singulisphaera acidiphila DSM 18658]